MEILDTICLKKILKIMVLPIITWIQMACGKIQQNGTKYVLQ